MSDANGDFFTCAVKWSFAKTIRIKTQKKIRHIYYMSKVSELMKEKIIIKQN